MTKKNQDEKSTRKVAPSLEKVKNIIAIASGKGGVGKSTVSTNLAIALQQAGFTVGLMDADVYGPSQPTMMGAGNEQPKIADGKLIPVTRHEIRFISMGLLMQEDTPVIWRGPMASKVIQQFVGSVAWGELDYLLIDLPPGTGDIQITLAQQASLTGAIIVTTPQKIALDVAKKGLQMFENVNVPIVGIVENMSGFTCKHCGETTAIFSEGGAESMAKKFGVAFLGSIPLDPQIMVSGDSGAPLLIDAKDSAPAETYRKLAATVVKQIEDSGNKGGSEPLNMEIDGKGNLAVKWQDNTESSYTPYHLRVNCPCADCIDENSGTRTLDPKKVPLDLTIRSFEAIGRYAIAIKFSDGHDSGIFRYDFLRKMAEKDTGIKSGSFSV